MLSVGVCRRLGCRRCWDIDRRHAAGAAGVQADPWIRRARAIAEYGIVFLMFSIGLEFSLPQFRSMRRLVLGLGSAQYLLLAAAVRADRAGTGAKLRSAVVLGAALAMSSTAIGIKLLAERNELSAPVAKPVIGVLLFQDLAVVPLLIDPARARRRRADEHGRNRLAGHQSGGAARPAAGFGQPVLRAWFRIVAQRKTGELFMLNVLLVTLLLAGCVTSPAAACAGRLCRRHADRRDRIQAAGGRRHPPVP